MAGWLMKAAWRWRYASRNNLNGSYVAGSFRKHQLKCVKNNGW